MSITVNNSEQQEITSNKPARYAGLNTSYEKNSSNERFQDPEDLRRMANELLAGADILIGTSNKILEVAAELLSPDLRIISIDFAPTVIYQMLAIRFHQLLSRNGYSIEIVRNSLYRLYYNRKLTKDTPDEEALESERLLLDFQTESIKWLSDQIKIHGEDLIQPVIDQINHENVIESLWIFIVQLIGQGKKTEIKFTDINYLVDVAKGNYLLKAFETGLIELLPLDFSKDNAYESVEQLIDDQSSQLIALYFSNTLEVVKNGKMIHWLEKQLENANIVAIGSSYQLKHQNQGQLSNPSHEFHTDTTFVVQLMVK